MYFFIEEYVVNWVNLDFNLDFFILSQGYFDSIIVSTYSFQDTFVNTKEKVCYVEFLLLYRNFLRTFVFHPYLNNFNIPTYLFYIENEFQSSGMYFYLNNFYYTLTFIQDMLGRFLFLYTHVLLLQKCLFLNNYVVIIIFFKDWFLIYFSFFFKYFLYFLFVFELLILSLGSIYFTLFKFTFDFYVRLLNFYINCFSYIHENVFYLLWGYSWLFFKKKFLFSLLHIIGGKWRMRAVDFYWDGVNFLHWKKFFERNNEEFFFVKLFNIYIYVFGITFFGLKLVFDLLVEFKGYLWEIWLYFFKEYFLKIISNFLFYFQIKGYSYKKNDFIFFFYFYIENFYWELSEIVELSVLWEIKYLQWKLLNRVLKIIFKNEDGILDYEEYDNAVKFLYRFGVGEKDVLDGFRFFFYNKLYNYIFGYIDVFKYDLNDWFEIDKFFDFREVYLRKILIFFKMRFFFFKFKKIFLKYNIFIFSFVLVYQYFFYLYFLYFFSGMKLKFNLAYLSFYCRYFIVDILNEYFFFKVYLNLNKKINLFFNKILTQYFIVIQWLKMIYIYIFYYFNYVFFFIRAIFFGFILFFGLIKSVIKFLTNSLLLRCFLFFFLLVLIINMSHYDYDLATVNIFFFHVINLVDSWHLDPFGVIGFIQILFNYIDSSLFDISFVYYSYNCFCSMCTYYLYEFYFWGEDLFFDYNNVFMPYWDKLYLKYVYQYTYGVKHLKRLILLPVWLKKWYLFYFIHHKMQFLYYYLVKVCDNFIVIYLSFKLWFFYLSYFFFKNFFWFYLHIVYFFYLKFYIVFCYFFYYIVAVKSFFVFYYSLLVIYVKEAIYLLFVNKFCFGYIFYYSNLLINSVYDYVVNFNIYIYHLWKYDCTKYFVYIDLLNWFFYVNTYIYYYIYYNFKFLVVYMNTMYTIFLQFILFNEFVENCFFNVNEFFSLIFSSYGDYVSREFGMMDIDKVLVHHRRRIIFGSISAKYQLFRDNFEKFVVISSLYNISIFRWDLFSLAYIDNYDYVWWFFYLVRYYILYVILFYILCIFFKKFRIIFRTRFYLYGYPFMLFDDFKNLHKFSILDHEWLTDTKWMGTFYTFSDFSDIIVNEEGDIVVESKVRPLVKSREKVQLDYFLHFYNKLGNFSSMFKEFSLVYEYWYKRFFFVKSLVDVVYERRIRTYRWLNNNFVSKNFWVPFNHLSTFVEKNREWMLYMEGIDTFYGNFVLEYLLKKYRDKTFYFNFKDEIYKHFYWYRFLQKRNIRNYSDLMINDFNLYTQMTDYIRGYDDSISLDNIRKFSNSKLKFPHVLSSGRPLINIEYQYIFDKIYRYLDWIDVINVNYFNNYFILGLKDCFFSYHFEELVLSKEEFRAELVDETSYDMYVDLGIYEELLDVETDFVDEVYNRRINTLIEESIFDYNNKKYNLFSYDSEGFIPMFIFHVFFLPLNTCFHFFKVWIKSRRSPKIIYNFEVFILLFFKYFYPLFFTQAIQWDYVLFPKIFFRRGKRRIKFNANSYKVMGLFYDGYDYNKLIHYNLIFGSGNCVKLVTSIGFFDLMFFNYTYVDIFLFFCLLFIVHCCFFLYNKLLFIYNE